MHYATVRFGCRQDSADLCALSLRRMQRVHLWDSSASCRHACRGYIKALALHTVYIRLGAFYSFELRYRVIRKAVASALSRHALTRVARTRDGRGKAGMVREKAKRPGRYALRRDFPTFDIANNSFSRN